MNADKALSRIRALAPEAYAADWDNSRVQIRGAREAVKKLAVALDPSPALMGDCLGWGADLVLTHHPLYFKPQAPTASGQYLDVLRLFVSAGAWLYAAHTSLDCRPDGPAFWLGRELGLKGCASLEPCQSFPAREVFFQAPSRFTEGEARPLVEAPGVHALSQSAAGEVRVVAEEHAWPEVFEELKGIFANKPIEYYVRRLETPVVSVGFGQVGDLPEPLAFEAFAERLERALFSAQKPFAGGKAGVAWAECGPKPETIRRVAYTTGSGASLIPAAFAAGADVFICGDVKHHAAMETPGLVLDVGHFILEEEMMRLFATELQSDLGREVEVRFFAGRSPFSFRVLA
ncbi:MAG: Nif3-like dinuclear metal center hexameric protein [Humidesulfovibrio sp.]|uniref:Nif3-like dinuclear metal center hexameric protein n=1 Tax=Humidesulfovibrio sp. TaxID=2910988 RepID=UPI0027360744|nr:Nif3-like dinuclear metal center hexameric protein [Humidesulfovibrio sp.]MDP2849198.1 Nif3-like dinuclear metal center hexameric protein [Humidesulfovibrio sp.]